jgi:hypothetical protein
MPLPPDRLQSDRDISDLAVQTLGSLIGARPQETAYLSTLLTLAAYEARAAVGGNGPLYRLRRTGLLQ